MLATSLRMCVKGVRSMATIPEVTKVGVVGAGGLMGHGIVQMAAETGYQVVAMDAAEAGLQSGMKAISGSVNKLADKAVAKGKLDADAVDAHVSSVLDRITPSTDLSSLADCDLVVEAIVENLDVKKAFFAELAGVVQPSAIFASNTSSFRIGDMAGPSGRPDKMVGLHFFNPVQLMKLVEVIGAPDTSDETVDIAYRWGQSLGKVAVKCADTPGFIVNRLLVPYIGESIAMLQRGDATKEDIDLAMKFGTGYPMGPITLADYTGLDTMLSVLQGWKDDFPSEFPEPPALLKQMVADGKLGRKTGQGFYKWDGNKIAKA